jgi:hypothetical protein
MCINVITGHRHRAIIDISYTQFQRHHIRECCGSYSPYNNHGHNRSNRINVTQTPVIKIIIDVKTTTAPARMTIMDIPIIMDIPGIRDITTIGDIKTSLSDNLPYVFYGWGGGG